MKARGPEAVVWELDPAAALIKSHPTHSRQLAALVKAVVIPPVDSYLGRLTQAGFCACLFWSHSTTHANMCTSAYTHTQTFFLSFRCIHLHLHIHAHRYIHPNTRTQASKKSEKSKVKSTCVHASGVGVSRMRTPRYARKTFNLIVALKFMHVHAFPITLYAHGCCLRAKFYHDLQTQLYNNIKVLNNFHSEVRRQRKEKKTEQF